MDLTLSPEEEAFRDELRSWLEANDPGREPEGDEAGFEFRRDWQKKLYEARLGGHVLAEGVRRRAARRWSSRRSSTRRSSAPRRRRWPTCSGSPWAGRPSSPTAPTSRRSATSLPILTAEEIWCQGFSEPESGSDLASREDDGGRERRRLGRHRAEGLDDARAPLEVVHAGRPHRPRRPQAQGAHVLPDGHGAGRGRRSGRWSRSPARGSSTSSSSRRRGSRTRTSSAGSATAGRSRSRR